VNTAPAARPLSALRSDPGNGTPARVWELRSSDSKRAVLGRRLTQAEAQRMVDEKSAVLVQGRHGLYLRVVSHSDHQGIGRYTGPRTLDGHAPAALGNPSVLWRHSEGCKTWLGPSKGR
jgi:hypothetical protein